MSSSNIKLHKDERIIREEFSSWISDTASEIPEEELKSSTSRKYYVYALCETTNDDSLIPFYIGKGTNDRVWSHSDETQAELDEIEEEAIKFNYTEEEIQLRKDTVSEKHKRIEELEKKDRLSRIIVKSGLTEYEAFMCESALINIFRLDVLSFSRADKLTNKVNGHANPFEKYAEIETAALTVEKYYEKYCKKPILVDVLNNAQEELEKLEKLNEQKKLEELKELKEDFEGNNIIFININDFYKDCNNNKLFPTEAEKNEAIREGARAFWGMKPENSNKDVKYAFAMVNGKIKGVFKILKDDDNSISHCILDMWHENYPRFDKLPGRKKDNDLTEAIYKDLEKDLEIEEHKPAEEQLAKIKYELYSKLSDATKELFKESIIRSGYEDWLKKKRRKDPKFPDYKNSRNSCFNDMYSKWEKENQKKWNDYKNGKRAKKPQFESNEESFLNNQLMNWYERRFLILDDLGADDPDYTKYINCSVRYSSDYVNYLKENNPDSKKIKTKPFDQNPITYFKSICPNLYKKQSKEKANKRRKK